MPQKLAIVDYGVGNLHSVYKKLLQLKTKVFITSSPQQISAADKIILPGIGHFGKAVQSLKALNLIDALNEHVIVCKKPVLGICLGMQLMGQASEEAPEEVGLGWFDQKVIRFHVPDTFQFKIPHIGWNQLNSKRENILLDHLSPSAAFYFSHSYHFSSPDCEEVLAHTDYGYPFVSAVAQDHIFGVQFHPEKSHNEGLAIFQNFLKI
jgi:glutamine amidotransferase